MSQPGWIKIHRMLMDHWSASEPEALSVWVRLLCEANYEDKKSNVYGQLVDVKRGQLVFGLDAFSARSGVSVKKLRRIIDMLIKDGMLGRQVFNKFSVITITCYDKYQDVGKQEAGEGQTEGKQRAAPKEGNNSRSEECDGGEPPLPSTDGRCPQKEILKLWAEIMPDLRQPESWDGQRAKALAARWKWVSISGETKASSLEFWRRLFCYIRKSRFLMGEEQQPGRQSFSLSLDWVVKAENFNKIIEGKYHNAN